MHICLRSIILHFKTWNYGVDKGVLSNIYSKKRVLSFKHQSLDVVKILMKNVNQNKLKEKKIQTFKVQ